MFKPLTWPRLRIEVDVAPEVLRALLRQTERTWAHLGRHQPHWSVVTDPRFQAGAIESNLDQFYASGEQPLQAYRGAVDRGGLRDIKPHTCLELGCGVGRTSVWLAREFARLIAVDISQPHLDVAAAAVARERLTNVELQHVDQIAKIRRLPRFDCFFSVIVLQHNTPPVAAFLLRTLLRKLKPGGIAYFQLLTYKAGASFSADAYLRDIGDSRKAEMHPLPQSVLWRIVADSGCRLVDVREDGFAIAADVLSNSVLLHKDLETA
jgi:SAM-dependent methyltransferase